MFYRVATSPNGWTDEFLCVEWFRKCFVPQVKARRESDAPFLLILDGHNSHITPEMRQLAIENDIHLFLLPPHTTHRLQPLDVGIFGPLQHAYLKHCNQYYVKSRGQEMERGDLIREYIHVRNKVFTPSLIKKAWDRSGITTETWSADFFDSSEFAPSYVTSTETHVPPSFPTDGDRTLLTDDPFAPIVAGVMPPPAEPPDDPDSDSDSDSGSEHHTSATVNQEDAPDTAMSDSEQTPRSEDEHPKDHASQRSTPHHCASQTTAPVPRSHSLSARDRELEALREEVARLRAENEVLSAQSAHAKAHAALARWHIGGLVQQLNLKNSKRKKKRPLRTTARCITMGEGSQQFEQEEAERAAEAARKEEERARKEAEEAARHVERERAAADDTHIFSGAIKRKTKDDLKTLALALHLPLNGTNAELAASIIAHLETNASDLSINPRFAPLYTATNGLAKAQKRRLPSDLADENIPPPSQRLRHDEPPPLAHPSSHTPPTPPHPALPPNPDSLMFSASPEFLFTPVLYSFGSTNYVNPTPSAFYHPTSSTASSASVGMHSAPYDALRDLPSTLVPSNIPYATPRYHS